MGEEKTSLRWTKRPEGANWGDFGPDDAVEIVGPDGRVFAKGLVRVGSARAAEWLGRRSDQLPEDMSHLVVHRDDLVLVR